MTNPPTDEIVELACRAYYNSGVPVHPPVFEGMRAALESALSHQGEVVSVDGLKSLCDEWERTDAGSDYFVCAKEVREVIGDGDFMGELDRRNSTEGVVKVSDLRPLIAGIAFINNPTGQRILTDLTALISKAEKV